MLLLEINFILSYLKCDISTLTIAFPKVLLSISFVADAEHCLSSRFIRQPYYIAFCKITFVEDGTLYLENGWIMAGRHREWLSNNYYL